MASAAGLANKLPDNLWAMSLSPTFIMVHIEQQMIALKLQSRRDDKWRLIKAESGRKSVGVSPRCASRHPLVVHIPHMADPFAESRRSVLPPAQTTGDWMNAVFVLEGDDGVGATEIEANSLDALFIFGEKIGAAGNFFCAWGRINPVNDRQSQRRQPARQLR
ncbi:MAG: hypothetical protein ABI273_09025, partial [Lacunisphaera sp.]